MADPDIVLDHLRLGFEAVRYEAEFRQVQKGVGGQPIDGVVGLDQPDASRNGGISTDLRARRDTPTIERADRIHPDVDAVPIVKAFSQANAFILAALCEAHR